MANEKFMESFEGLDIVPASSEDETMGMFGNVEAGGGPETDQGLPLAPEDVEKEKLQSEASTASETQRQDKAKGVTHGI
jgi:hypothetical protein